MAKTPPTERQLEVLHWIADGCPAGTLTDPKYKVSAYALERRNLVRVKRRKNPWLAEITDAGSQLLASGGAASMTAAEPATSTSNAFQTRAEAPELSIPSNQPVQVPVRARAVPAQSATQKMMDRLVVERVLEFTNAETGRYRQLVTVARRKKLFPDDMELVVNSNWNKPCTVELRRRPEWQLVTLAPVDVPAVIRTPHGVVAKLKQLRTDRLGMDAPRWNWTLRIVQGLVMEAERLGYGVAAVPVAKPDYYGRVSREERNNGHLKVGIGEDEVHLLFSQATERVPHLLTASELRRQAHGYSVPTEEVAKTDFLSIRLSGLEPPFWQSEWTENDTTRADSLLPRIIQEIELRAARAVEVRLEGQRRDDEKRRQWEGAREQAIRRLNEMHRASALLDQAERFQRVQLLGDYIAALRIHIDSMNPLDAGAATDWLRWAQTHARTISPLLGEIRMPDDPEPTADAIKPYMKGWSPYGPDLGMWR
ncbi:MULTISPECIES: hypothetical protein [unclassified Arthrobacter]|uniref:hypothetical protein n=1 Tax=unclassified Arthrobacter TaxID=235627 RepID=UPI002DFC1FA1|nr:MULTISPECIES: hypothetical protein [unclassified Arthrobacter]MEC5193455.1 hypothetical protein [Arthrobacter sp. MP_M4]MEC5204931.1 hypothetical protein [Arthrobacter sp. MP_M7]